MPRLKHLIAMLFIVLLPNLALPQSMPLNLSVGNRTSAAELRLDQKSFVDGRLVLDLTLIAPTILTDLDADLGSRGKIYNGDIIDMKWQGGTQLLRSEASGRLV
ncbi:MAG: hypothetical protein ACRC14_15650, partial [Paracoccaceae bacterium]